MGTREKEKFHTRFSYPYLYARVGYRIAAVVANVQYQGKKDVVNGNCPLVMFENATLPILLGRELLGVPKLYSDIPALHDHRDGSVTWETSLYGHLLFGIEVKGFEEQDQSVCDRITAKGTLPLLGCKYVDSPESNDAVSYATATPIDAKVKRVYVGKDATVYFGSPTHKNIGFMSTIIDKVKEMPIGEITNVKMLVTTETLRIDQTKKLV